MMSRLKQSLLTFRVCNNRNICRSGHNQQTKFFCGSHILCSSQGPPMKTIFTLSALSLLLLAGCSSDEQSAEPVSNDVTDEQSIDEAVVPAPIGEEDASDEQNRPQVVEESVGEPDEADDQEKPIILAQADTNAPVRDWQFKEGEHYFRMVPTQPTLGGADKIEVAEFFWYGCGHCYEFESYINPWAESVPANARFIRIPASWNPLVKLHAQLYYTEEVLVTGGKIANPAEFRASVFNEYHRRGNRLTSLASIQDLFAKAGVSADDFQSIWNSFEVAQKLNRAQDLARRYAITGVPAMVVNGKYRTGKAQTGSYPALLAVVDELVERETSR